MTEKRYQWYIDGVDIWDNQKEERIDDTPTLLNELSKENDHLKKVIEEHKNTLKGQSNSIYQLKKENEFLKRRLEEWV